MGKRKKNDLFTKTSDKMETQNTMLQKKKERDLEKENTLYIPDIISTPKKATEQRALEMDKFCGKLKGEKKKKNT